MSKEVEIEAIKPFGKSGAGDVCDVGERFPVEEGRATQLEQLGLARRTGKAAPEPANKMAPAPENKGTVPKTVTVRRSPAKISGRG